jgi:hypothetical protein
MNNEYYAYIGVIALGVMLALFFWKFGMAVLAEKKA